jgi:hypothetical protein
VLASPRGARDAARAFEPSGARVFASSHTCLPVLQDLGGGRLIANNGAAGMPNFRGTGYGIATRISLSPGRSPLYGLRAGALHVEAMALEFDADAWRERFLSQWPEGSEAHRSYFERIVHGPQYSTAQALRGRPALAA